jgi:hypothetical protein
VHVGAAEVEEAALPLPGQAAPSGAHEQLRLGREGALVAGGDDAAVCDVASLAFSGAWLPIGTV